ncbi:TPA: DEAD/DEAH box helicase [Candidatus Woesearchaeota archaeon]|nr:ATP-dependent DNA helicase Hel308 [uncultured archaeon]HII63925.1 DEAD/DEAH box helicase [Candidatus Woesearchaeota archaeon]HII65983.1 DEAD/DEAH box helicase [Candidatus Woesearchaeota archaeon]
MDSIKGRIPEQLHAILGKEVSELRPAQSKAVKAGLLEGKSLLVCTPTASGKTLIAELAAMKAVFERKGKAVYIVPLKALAAEKYRDFTRRYGSAAKIALSIGDLDSADPYLAEYDIIITTSEKLDSLLRHHAPWIAGVSTVIIDEIHLLNDPGRGPTLEILITILKRLLKNVQIIGLSATIGNPEELAEWLDAKLVEDDWRPVKLKKGVYLDGKLEFFE